MSPAASGALLRGVDVAAFVAALGAALRRRGVPVPVTSDHDLARALDVGRPRTVSALYWTTRVTLIHRQADLAAFDEVFDSVFGGGALRLDPPARRQSGETRGHRRSARREPSTQRGPEENGLPWATSAVPVSVGGQVPDGSEPRMVRQPLPSRLVGAAPRPFEDFDADDLTALADWLAAMLPRWPTRPGRRVRPGSPGHRVLLRQTLARARRTGWEPVEVVRGRLVRRPRRLVMLCDVSQSMQPYAAAYLTLMRAISALRMAEVFAFATSLTRLTAVLRHTSPRVAVEQASTAVGDRFGGTRIAANLQALLHSRHGHLLRGAVVVIGSDGWDSDPPEGLAAAMERIARRAHRVVWLNPRAGAPGFRPRVGGMAAALPYCDDLLPAQNVPDLAHAIDVLVADPPVRGPAVPSSVGSASTSARQTHRGRGGFAL